MRKFIVWLLPIGWMSIIFYSSATPYEEQDIKPFLGTIVDFSFLEPFVDWISFTYNQSIVSVEELGIHGFIEFFIRKGAHIAVFFLLTCFFCFAFRKTTMIRERMIFIFSFVLTVIYAVLDELHQGITPNRTPYAGDVLLDSFGAFIAVICMILLNRYRKIGA
ncbi:VanZ family protein [Oceanobacillus damuensis]|uniref:VanZ family protein n=1 Tax=Oceanobacillus damuensis TaxID=937928 RepID=UPI0008338223|nr:VanZ family protein [Oceanobacillus damuensis]